MITDHKPIRVRFAPSPTGYLHVGGARTALFNWLFARHNGGKFILRIEDTDVARSEARLTESILVSLRWLGLDWDEGPEVGGEFGPYLQSQRQSLYREYAEKLVREGKAYYCYCTPEELEQKKQAAMAAGLPPHYDKTCCRLTAEQRAMFEREGRRPSIRFAMPENETIIVNDIVRGSCEFNSSVYGDFIILRSDGGSSFHLANVVDDSLMRVSHVVRGEDHFPNTPRHILLYRALGFDVPQFAHLSMILGPDRSKLSKRHGAVSVESFRASGYFPEAMVNYLALLGWAPPDEQEVMTPEEVVAKFELERVNKSAAVFDYGKLDFMNGLRLRQKPLEEIVALSRDFFAGGRFASDGVPIPADLDEARFEKVVDLARQRSDTLAQIPEKCRSILAQPVYSEEAVALLKESPQTPTVLETFSKLLEQAPEPMSEDAIKALFKDTQKQSGAKGKALYGPVRVAITGEEHGPELVGVLQVLSRVQLLERLTAARKVLEGL